MSQVEQPIMKPTACRVDQHVFVWTGGTFKDPDEPYDKLMLCDCGALTWQAARPMEDAS